MELNKNDVRFEEHNINFNKFSIYFANTVVYLLSEYLCVVSCFKYI